LSASDNTKLEYDIRMNNVTSIKECLFVFMNLAISELTSPVMIPIDIAPKSIKKKSARP